MIPDRINPVSTARSIEPAARTPVDRPHVETMRRLAVGCPVLLMPSVVP